MTTTTHHLDPDTLSDFPPNNPDGAFAKLEHEDGSVTFFYYDDDPQGSNPRDFDGNVATLIQENSRYASIDDDEAGLRAARDHFGRADPGGREYLIRRYIRMFRPDILYYCDYWSAGEDSYGWGYITRAALSEDAQRSIDPEDTFNAEIGIYRKWAEGEIYGAIHYRPRGPIIETNITGDEIVGVIWEETDACWGFLDYDSLAQIAEQFTDSPVIEEVWL